MGSKPVRIPDETYGPLRTVSGLLGKTPGNVLQEAFLEYVANHEDEFNRAFDHAKKYIISRDVQGLLSITEPDASVNRCGGSARERAKSAAARVMRVAGEPRSKDA